MSISDDEVQKLAHLSRLNLSEKERDQLSDDLNEILELAEKIDGVDTDGVKPTYHALPLENVMREDAHRTSPDPDDVLDYAPDASDGFFNVPGVIDDDS